MIKLFRVACGLVAAVAAVVMGCRPAPAQPTTAPSQLPDGLGVFVTPARAEELVSSGATILDARELLPYLRSHPSGAVRTPWQDFSDPENLGALHPDDSVLRSRIEALGVSIHRPVVVLGAWNEGWGEEGRIYWMLDALGHPEVYIVYGGAPAWQVGGHPVTQTVPDPSQGRFPIERRAAAFASIDGLAESSGRVFDVRTSDEFEGATPYGAVRGGHVPGATHLDWRAVFDERGELLPREELEALFPSAETPVVAYCTGGVRSGFTYAVLRALGRENVANYAGSWWEYAASDRPVE